MPTIYFHELAIQLSETRLTASSLNFTIDDKTYYASVTKDEPEIKTLRFKDDQGQIYYLVNAKEIEEELQFSLSENVTAENTNACISNAVTLPAGTYRVKLKGGRGGDGGTPSGVNAQHSLGLEAIEQTYEFQLSEPTPIYAFKGGDGMPGTAGGKDGPAYAPSGGGSSGGPSAIIVKGQLMISQGGFGGSGGNGVLSNGTLYEYGAGAGGGDGPQKNGAAGFANAAQQFAVGGGGGAAPGGLGGAGYTDPNNTRWYSNPGQDAVGNDSGAGGTAFNTNSYAGVGGVPGTGSVQWSCGGHALYSYGGGSGGGLATKNKGATGGSGGSGTTSTSSSSYIDIYKLN